MPPDGSEEAALPSLHALSLSSAASTPPPIASTSTAIIDGAEQAGLTARPSTSESAPLARYDGPITYRAYQGEADLEAIVALVDDELSEPYNLYTYRYFLDDWCVGKDTLQLIRPFCRRAVSRSSLTRLISMQAPPVLLRTAFDQYPG